METDPAPANLKIIQHLNTYPVVSDSYNYVWNYYAWAKEKSNLVNYTCGLAENGIAKVATPIAKKLEPHVKSLDDAADSQLNRLDANFPMVKKPTRELWEDSWSYCDQRVRPTVDAVKRPIVQSYTSVRTTISSGKDTGLAYASKAIDTADHYVDRFLPSDEEQETVVAPPAASGEGRPAAAADETTDLQELFDDATETQTDDAAGNGNTDTLTARSKAVLRKTQRRLFRKGERNLTEMQQLGQRAFANAIDSVGLLETFHNAQAGLGDLNVEFWRRLETLQDSYAQDDVVSSSDDGSDAAFSSDTASLQSDSAAVENRLNSLMAHYVVLTGQVVTVFSDMLYGHLDDANKTRWDSANHAISEFYSRLRVAPASLTGHYLGRIRETFQDVYESINSSFHNVVGSRKGSNDATKTTEEPEPFKVNPEAGIIGRDKSSTN